MSNMARILLVCTLVSLQHLGCLSALKTGYDERISDDPALEIHGDVEYPAGENLFLSCEADVANYDLISELRWFTPSGEPIPQSDRIYSEEYPNAAVALIIKNLQEEDCGEYQCTALYAANHHLEATVNIFTYADPEIRVSGSPAPREEENLQITVDAGQPVELVCQLLKGIPRPDVWWRKVNSARRGGYEFPDGESIKDGRRISIPKANHRHSGVYICLTENYVHKSVEATIKLNVEYPPVIQQDFECSQYKLNSQWNTEYNELDGSDTQKSARECQRWCQVYCDKRYCGPYSMPYYFSDYSCAGWTFWADSGQGSESSWCHLFRNGSEPLNTSQPSPGAVSGLPYACDSGKGPTVGNYFLDGVDLLNRKYWKYFLANDTDIDQDGYVSDSEVEHKFHSYMKELFKIMDQDKNNTITLEELRSLRFDLHGLNKVIDLVFENWPLKPAFLAADANKDGFYDEHDFYLPAEPLHSMGHLWLDGPLDGKKTEFAIEKSKSKREIYSEVSKAILQNRGYSLNKGRVWINSQHVCDIGQKEGNVICKSFGFEGLEMITTNNYDKTTQKYICNGTEARLEDCQRTACDKNTDGKTKYYKGAHRNNVQFGMGVVCNKTIGSLRLVGGKDSSSGDIFLGHLSKEGMSCPTKPGYHKEAEVICRELGFPGFLKTTTGSAFTAHVYPRPYAIQSWFNCTGNEAKLTDCHRNDMDNKYYSFCDWKNIRGIVCKSDANDARVVNKHLEEMVDWNRYSAMFEKFGRFLLTADSNNDGKVSLEEIIAKAKENMASMLQLLDQTRDGYVSVEDFTALYMTVEPVHQVMDQFVDYWAGEIDLYKFCQLILMHMEKQASLSNYDKNSDGKLNVKDFYSDIPELRDWRSYRDSLSGNRRVLKTRRWQLSDYLSPSLSQELDKNQDGKIQRQELRLFTDDIFKSLDVDGSGAITLEDLYSLMHDNGYSCLHVKAVRSYITHVTNTAKAQFEKLTTYFFTELDLDGNGEIGLKEFLQSHVPCALTQRHLDLGGVPCNEIFYHLNKLYDYFKTNIPVLDVEQSGDVMSNAACKIMP